MAGAPLHADVRFWRDPDLPGVEARSSTYRTKAFRTHTHRACIISLVDAGSTRFTQNGATSVVTAGQMVVIEAGTPHACNPDPGTGLSYRLLSLAPGWLAGASPESGAPPRFPCPVLTDPELFDAWGQLHTAYAWGAPAAEKQALLMACLRELVARHADSSPAEPSLHNPAIAQACRHIQANPGVFVPLSELARQAGLSRHHFLRVFKTATGLPPHAYQLQQAIEHAKLLLAGGMPISQAALDAGFSDQSHFSRLFRQFTGATPRQYLATSAPEPCPAAAPG